MDYNKRVKKLHLSRLQIYNTIKHKIQCSQRSFYNYLDCNLEICDPRIKRLVDYYLDCYEAMVNDLDFVETIAKPVKLLSQR